MSVSASPVVRAALIGVAFSGLAVGADPAGSTHYALEAPRSTLQFQFVQAGAQNNGRFGKFAVTLDFAADNPASGRLEVTVDTNSLDTGDGDRDATLRGADLFDVAKFPQARFTATQITRTANGYDALGKLTIRGVSRDQHVAFTFRTAQEQGKTVAYLTGRTVIRRLDFGIGQGDWKSTEWVGNEVTVSYSLRLLR